jgi:RNA polymerase sigma factor (sigma-70 family)
MGDSPVAPEDEAQVVADSVFDPFFGQVYPELIKRGLRRCNNLHDAEDAAAEIMVEVRRRWFTIQNHEAYAHRSLLNRLGKAHKCDHAKGTDLRSLDELPARPDPDSDIENYAGREWVEQVLDRLPPVQRTVMHLLVGGFKYTDIADELGCSEDAVRQNVRHARLKLRTVLRPFHRDPEASGPTTTRRAAE